MTLEEQTKALLPCYCNAVDDEPHMIDCPANYRGAVVIALAENNAEIERLSTALGQANADLMGCRDGALVRDLKARVAELEAESDKLRMTEALFNQGLRLAASDLKHIVVAAKIEGLRRAKEIIGDELLECDDETGEPIYLHSVNCTNYCDYACNAKGEQQAREFQTIFADIEAEIAALEKGK